MLTSQAIRAVLAGLLLVLTLFMVNCSKNPQESPLFDESKQVDKVISAGIAEKDLKPEFEKLTMLLAQRASKVIGKIRAIDKIGTERAELPFAKLNLDVDLPRSFATSDGRILETTLERAQPCQEMPSAPTSKIIFAPDPDRFLRDEEAYVVKGLLIDRGTI